MNLMIGSKTSLSLILTEILATTDDYSCFSSFSYGVQLIALFWDILDMLAFL